MAPLKCFRIRRSRLDKMIKRATALAKRTSREICGLIIYNGYFLDLVECENKSRRIASSAFYFHEVRRKVKAAEALGYEVVGAFHSHPFWVAKPGTSDIENAVNDSLILVIDCTNSKAKLWRIKNGKATEIKFKWVREWK